MICMSETFYTMHELGILRLNARSKMSWNNDPSVKTGLIEFVQNNLWKVMQISKYFFYNFLAITYL